MGHGEVGEGRGRGSGGREQGQGAEVRQGEGAAATLLPLFSRGGVGSDLFWTKTLVYTELLTPGWYSSGGMTPGHRRARWYFTERLRHLSQPSHLWGWRSHASACLSTCDCPGSTSLACHPHSHDGHALTLQVVLLLLRAPLYTAAPKLSHSPDHIPATSLSEELQVLRRGGMSEATAPVILAPTADCISRQGPPF